MSSDNGASKLKRKPLPWRCGACGEKAVRPAVVPYTQKITDHGHTYTIAIPDLEVARCELCGETSLDRIACERISAAICKAMGVMEADEIRAKIAELGMTAEELAEALGANFEIVLSWIKGHAMQPKSMDNLMRLYFQLPEARALLKERATQARASEPVRDEALAVAH